MQVYGASHVHGAQAINAPHATKSAATNPVQRGAAASDELSISETGSLLAQIRDLPDMRTDRVQALRAEIAAGTYENDEKLDAALERLLDEIA